MTKVVATAAIPRGKTRKAPRAGWFAPTGLILLSLIPIPILAGAARLGELTGGAVATSQNARFLDSPVPVVTHIVSVTVFSLLGAFQFVPALRRRGWHRIASGILIPAGLIAALSGMWMTVFYPHPPGDGVLLSVLRLVFGAAMAASVGLGIRGIVRRDFLRHGAWMTRAYAIGVGAGTQALLLIPESIFFGPAAELPRAVAMGAAWVVNLAVAEYVIRRRATPARGRPRPSSRPGKTRAFTSQTRTPQLKELP